MKVARCRPAARTRAKRPALAFAVAVLAAGPALAAAPPALAAAPPALAAAPPALAAASSGPGQAPSADAGTVAAGLGVKGIPGELVILVDISQSMAASH